MTGSGGPAGSLEGKSPTLFVVAGALLVAFAANTALETFSGTSYPPIQGLVGPVGFLLGVVGLFGLYPALADETPALARLAALVAAIPAVGWILIIVRSILRHVLGVADLPEALAAVPLVVIASMIPTFALFGVACLRAGVHSRAVGVLLLVPAAMFLLLVTNAAPHVLIDAGHVVGYLGTGVLLWSEGVPDDRAESVADPIP